VSERWVINASPVILLSKANVIHLLPKLCDELVIPSGVVTEVGVGERGDLGRKWLAGEGVRFIKPALPIAEELISAELGRGEAEVLSWPCKTTASERFWMIGRDGFGRKN
jgi:predicted nucleic acid-binding protein